MTAAENQSIAPRASRAFKFLKNGTTEFFPGAGTRLHFANRDVDTLVAQVLPAGLLQSGDTVTVQYNNGSGSWVTVFVGDVDRIVDRHGRGTDRVQDVTVAGPWSKLNRLVFRQTWSVAGAGTGGAALTISSSRVILNQDATGAAQTMAQQLGEILGYAAGKCGFATGTIDASGQYLPADEARDITCADAIRRELRFFPKSIVRFDYSNAVPVLQILEPAGGNAAYAASVPKTERVYEYDAHPVRCVCVRADTTDILVGGASLIEPQTYPLTGDPASLDCLNVTVPLERGSASTTSESFKSVTEDIPSNFATDAAWWKSKHPRLANVAESAITITNGTRSPSRYPRIAKSTKGEIEAAGLHCEVSIFTCDCKISTTDDEEESIKLRMDFLTTDATTRTYTWQTGSSSVAGETLPDGLAEALYRQRSQSLLSERMTIRLDAVFPKLGDMADGLYLQSIDVDCAAITAQLSFGQPEHLSAEDMRSLLNGFRQRGYATTAKLRANKADENADEADAPGGIPPISSSDWSPGTKAKTTLKKLGANGGGVGAIKLNTAAVPQGQTVEVKTLTIKGAGTDGADKELKVLATDDMEFPPVGVTSLNELTGDVTIEGDDGIEVTEDGQTILISLAGDRDEEGSADGYCNAISEEGAGGGGGNGMSGSGEGGGGYGDEIGNDISDWPCDNGEDEGETA